MKYIAKQTEKNSDEKGNLVSNKTSYEDIVWSLINTKEFLFNH